MLPSGRDATASRRFQRRRHRESRGACVDPASSGLLESGAPDASKRVRLLLSREMHVAEPIGIGVVGTGDWGANLVRNFASLPAARLAALCDSDPLRLSAAAARHPGARAVGHVDEVARATDVLGVVVSASAVNHYSLAKTLLEAGKDVFVEKPLAL